MKSSSAPNKTPSLKRPLAFFFFLPPFPPFFLLCFSSPTLCCFYFTLRKHACLICAGGPPRKEWLRHRCLCVCVCVCLRLCVRASVCMFACTWYDNCTLIWLSAALTFFELVLLISLRASTCTDPSERCLSVHVCLAAPLSQSLEWKKDKTTIVDGEVKEASEVHCWPDLFNPTTCLSLSLSPCPPSSFFWRSSLFSPF